MHYDRYFPLTTKSKREKEIESHPALKIFFFGK